jgi:OOP family OmpA-OmpF porin
MTKRLIPPSPHRIGAVAIAAALAAFAGVAAAQSRAQTTHPGFVVDSSGNVVRGASGECVRPGQGAAASSVPCPADATTVRTASASGATAASSQPAASGATAAGAPSRLPGYAVSSDGQLVRNGFGECVRAGHWTAANAADPCDRVALAQAAPVGAASASAAAGPASARSAAAGSGATGVKAAPGYVQDGQANNVVLSGFGTCVRSGFWTPGMAAEPCDRITVAQVEPPPAPVAAAPEPKLEPAPAPLAQAQPAPAPIAPEPPRPVIQRITLATDVLFEFDKAQLRESGKSKLDEIAEATKDARVEEILVAGYADPIGSERYNEKLSAARASAVREYLTQKGVSPERIKSEGRGETREFTEGKCDKLTGSKLIACFEPNRRVDVDLLGSRVVAGDAPAAGAGAGTTGGSSAPAGGGSTTR